MTPELIAHAAATLAASPRGKRVLRDLHALLENGGDSLDAAGQQAAFTLMQGAWGSLSGTVRDTLREEASK